MEETGQSPALIARVADARVRCIDAFAVVAGRLSDVSSAAAALAGQARELLALLTADEMEDDPLAAMSAALADLGAAMSHSGVSASGSSSLNKATRALDDIRQEAQRLTVVAVLTRVTAQSLGIDWLDDFVVNLRRLNATLVEDANALDTGARAVSNTRAHSAAAMTKANDALKRAELDLSAARGDAAVDAADTTKREVAAIENTLRKAALQETTALVAAIQFSDSMAQRLEHVATALDMSAGRESAVSMLVSAQLAALQEDGAQTVAAADLALQRLSNAAAAARDGLRGQTGDAGAATLLRHRREEIGKVMECEVALTPDLARASAAAAEIGQRLEEARRRFDNLGNSSVEINLSAINVGLLTGRGGAGNSPLGVLAKTVREGAGLYEARSSTCAKALEALSADIDAEALAAVDAALGRFRATVENCAKQLVAAERAASSLNTLRDAAVVAADTLTKDVAEARRALQAIEPELGALADGGAFAGTGSMPGAMLDDVAAIYTMDREREVHAAVCGTPPPAICTHATTSSDDLSSIFF